MSRRTAIASVIAFLLLQAVITVLRVLSLAQFRTSDIDVSGNDPIIDIVVNIVIAAASVIAALLFLRWWRVGWIVAVATITVGVLDTFHLIIVNYNKDIASYLVLLMLRGALLYLLLLDSVRSGFDLL